MKFLVIETSGEANFVLFSNESDLTRVDLPMRQQRDHLLPTIDQMLDAAKLKVSDLDFIAIGKGPGSFTGIRIGVLTAKTLSYACKVPLVPFCSLLAYTPECEKPYLLVVDAKSHGYYLYDGENVILQEKDSTEFLGRVPIYSPHPDQLPFKTSEASLNLSFLLNHLEQAFAAGETSSHDSLKISYLVHQQ